MIGLGSDKNWWIYCCDESVVKGFHIEKNIGIDIESENDETKQTTAVHWVNFGIGLQTICLEWILWKDMDKPLESKILK